MTDIDLDKLEALADRCMSGDPWYKEGDLCGRQTFGQFLTQDRAFIAAANPAAIKSLIASAREAAAEIERLKGAVGTSVRILSAIPKPTYVDGNPTYFPSDDVPEDIFTALSYLRAAQMDGEG